MIETVLLVFDLTSYLIILLLKLQTLFICVLNEKKENITATFTFKHASGVERTHEKKEIPGENGRGTCLFLSHEAYKKWANIHGDVFEVEIKISIQLIFLTQNCTTGMAGPVLNIKRSSVTFNSSLTNFTRSSQYCGWVKMNRISCPSVRF